MRIHHVNMGLLHAPPGPRAACHGLVLAHAGRLALVDTGIGLADVARPLERVGREAIEAAGFQFHAGTTAIRRVEQLGHAASDVQAVVLTHGDPDHVGGLADFPWASVHVGSEEHAALGSADPRYRPPQFAHGPRWVVHGPSSERWFGLEARRVELFDGVDTFLVPLFGHTLGHCGVAVLDGERWLLHVGDAYYLRVELSHDEHPVRALSAARAADDAARRASLEHLRRLQRDHADAVDLVGYHDFGEFPAGALGADAGP
jgi:glyoxylase-like metal-dependent hydrolase (beta-lactamase superfamily II)